MNKSTPKFKVGDKVRIITQSLLDEWKMDSYIVSCIYTTGYRFTPELKHEDGWSARFKEEDLELIDQ